MAAFDWNSWDDLLEEAVSGALHKVLDKGSKRVYALVFHDFYLEEMRTFSLPQLAANTLEYLKDWGKKTQWSPPDWRYTEMGYASRELKARHKALVSQASESDMPEWQASHRCFMESFVRVSRRLRIRFKAHKNVTPDFAVLVLDEEGDDMTKWLQACLDGEEFARLFPKLAAEAALDQSADGAALSRKLDSYRKDLHGHADKVLKLGESALPMLLEELQNPKNAWAAADMLGLLGIVRDEVVKPLRKRAGSGHESSFHEIGALALLGDIDFVLTLVNNKKTRSPALRGLGVLYSAERERCVHPFPLDYGPLERLLGQVHCDEELARELESTWRIPLSDVDAALLGLESAHLSIRLHATQMLGDRTLLKPAASRILPALAERLRDDSANVRRLAVAGLGNWGKQGKAYANEVRALENDPDGKVRILAGHFSQQREG